MVRIKVQLHAKMAFWTMNATPGQEAAHGRVVGNMTYKYTNVSSTWESDFETCNWSNSRLGIALWRDFSGKHMSDDKTSWNNLVFVCSMMTTHALWHIQNAREVGNWEYWSYQVQILGSGTSQFRLTCLILVLEYLISISDGWVYISWRTLIIVTRFEVPKMQMISPISNTHPIIFALWFV